ncbi:clavesin-2-like [Stegodyphus dumicola]|uniref:clavesin-2-like n=1 Tax=Stegodyphus dumicola TaxID=202533 RepID=UPI0015B28460|nr:clavesin-2-like [Stegodyphus dumicola]
MDYTPLLMEGLTPEMEKIAERELCETSLVKKESLAKIKELVERKLNWKEATIEDLMATSLTIICILYRLEACSVCGCVIVIDHTDVTLQILFKNISPKFLIFIFSCLQNCIPLRIKGVHLVNEPCFYQIFFEIIKVGIPKKLRERMFLHGRKIESLHKFIPPEILPNELGGKTGPFDSTEMFNYVLGHEPLVEEMNKCGFKK